jgi:hypothetical protein
VTAQEDTGSPAIGCHATESRKVSSKKLYAADITVPVIMATGKLPHVEFNLHPWIRPIAILLKPYTPEEVLRTVEYVLRPPFEGP